MRELKKILIIQLGPLGNWLLATGAFQAIRRAYPNGEITHLTRHNFREMAELQNCFDEVLPAQWTASHSNSIDMKDLIEETFFETIWRKRLEAKNFDAVFDFNGGTKIKDIYAGLRNSPAIFARGDLNSAIVSVYRRVLETAGIDDLAVPYLEIAKQSTAPPFTAPYAVLIPKSELEQHGKNWPLENFMDLARNLQRQGIQPVVLGVEENLQALAPLRQLVGQGDLVGQTDLTSLGPIFKNAKFVVGVDTGTTHMAALLGTPTLALYGPTDMSVWKLVGPRTRYIKHEAMELITVQEVLSNCVFS